MRRGTTPVHTFFTDVDLTGAETIFLTYQQGGETVIEKIKEELTVREESVAVQLTQEETLAFRLKERVRIQIRARFPDGAAVASEIVQGYPREILKDGEI